MKIKDLFKELLAICVLVPLLHNFCSSDSLINFSQYHNNSISQDYVFYYSNSNLSWSYIKSAWQWNYAWNFYLNSWVNIDSIFISSNDYSLIKKSSTYYEASLVVCCNSSSTTSACFNVSNSSTFYYPAVAWTWISFTSDFSFSCSWWNYLHIVPYTIVNNTSDFVFVDYSLNWSYVWSSCDYSSYESTINSLSWSLASCQSDLTSCQNSSSNSSCQSTWYISDYIPWNILFSWSKSFSSAWYTNMFNYWDYGAWTYCLKFSSTSPQTLSMWFANGWTTAPTNLYSLYNDQYWNWICLYWNKPYLNVKLNSSSNTIDYEVYKLTDLLDSQFNCPVSSWGGSSCNTWAILSWYILVSSINQSYCVNNWLCPSCPTIDEEYCINNFNLISPSSCPVCSGGVSNWSSLWINNIQHLWASNIYMSIPEEISRDYSYSNSWEIMEVDVEGYNVDYDYINNVVEIQKYKPSDEDFNNIVWILAQYMPIIVIFIGLLFLYKLLKKPFKSKL